MRQSQRRLTILESTIGQSILQHLHPMNIWWLKILAKVVLSRVGLPYRTFAKLGMFRHGRMNDAEYALQVFTKHASRISADQSWTGVELGPGDTVFSAVLARAHGATRYWVIDTANFAESSIATYRQMTEELERKRLLRGKIEFANINCLDALLDSCNASYLVKGVDSLKVIPDASVDMVWSQAVLEHIRLARFEEMCAEMYRILRPGGYASHHVDFKDHLSGGLNNLRFSASLWEKNWFAPRSGFYTNRIRPSMMVKVFRQAGFNVTTLSETRWSTPPLGRHHMAMDFRACEESDFLISSAHYLLQKPY